MLDLQSALQSARRLHQSGGGSVLDVLLRSTPLDPAVVAEQVRMQAGVDVLLDQVNARPDHTWLDAPKARALGCVPLPPGPDGEPRVAMADPWNEAAVRRIAAALGRLPQLVAAPSAWLDRWSSSAAVGAMPAADVTPAKGVNDVGGPVVDFVDAAVRAAYDSGASDVHFECDRSGVGVKLRQDGVMVRFARLDDPQRAQEVISRIKVLAQLDITERRIPQDGRFRFPLHQGSVDLRVSIMPSIFGEDAVLRLLDKAQLRTRQAAASLDLLGFGDAGAERIRALAALPHGMLLVTGPTGSGKTTTVYAVLSEVNTGFEKIITIEDPVEYELPGVLQIPVNERKGLTFAKGLRSILRHDPDRILVGEIRDAETAEIAVQSALTGHQVFTTVHANSVFDVTGRFRHFGLDMFGFMSALNGLVVQRLVRQVCPACVASRPVADHEARWLRDMGVHVTSVASAVGCSACHGTGYRGRSVLAEVHAIDDGFRDLVIGGSPVSALRAHVARSEVVSLASKGAQLVLQGKTTPEEIRRVVGW